MKSPKTREQLVRCLQKASEIEHQLLCAYLVTAYTVKQDDSEGGFAEVSEDPDSPGFKQRKFMFRDNRGSFGNGPSRVIIDIAVQEMLHLTLVNNLLASVTNDLRSDFPFFERKNFPLTPEYLRERFGYNKPKGQAWVGYWPFNVETMRGWEWFENFVKEPFNGPSYQGERIEDIEEDKHFIDAELEISTLVELYKAIAMGVNELGALEVLPDGKRLFCGNKETQLNTQGPMRGDYVPDIVNEPRQSSAELSRFPGEWGLLKEINTIFEAIESIHIIVVQGEGNTDEWVEFIKKLGFNPDKFERAIPRRGQSHYDDFKELREGLEALVEEDPTFKPARQIHVFEELGDTPTPAQVLAFDLAELFDDLYSTMMSILAAAVRHPIPPPESTDEEIIVARYERITLAQTGLAAMLYILSPFGNALPQIPSGYMSDSGAELGIAPRFVFNQRPDDWQSLVIQLDHLSQRALGLVDRLPDKEVWLQPNYLAFRESGMIWPKVPFKTVIREFVGLNLEFIARRFENVQGNRPIANSQEKGNLHSCMGLNECRGLDITHTAMRAGEGRCATAIPHTCAGLNQCNQQSTCGFGDQNVPGENIGAGSGGCQTPPLPSGRNTAGNNIPGGSVFDRAKGNVWRHARILFEKRITEQGIPFGPSSGPGGVGANDFPGSEDS